MYLPSRFIDRDGTTKILTPIFFLKKIGKTDDFEKETFFLGQKCCHKIFYTHVFSMTLKTFS